MAIITNYEGSNDDYMNIGTAAAVAQGFQVTGDYTVTSISIFGGRGAASSGTFLLEICSGAKDSAALTSQTVTTSTLTAFGSAAWNEITLITPIDVVSGIQYFLRIDPQTGSASDEIRWSTDSTSPSYSNGTQWILSPKPSTWTEYTSRDGLFRIDGIPTIENIVNNPISKATFFYF